MFEEQQLSQHFSLHQLTHTDLPSYQDLNRESLTEPLVQAGRNLAGLLEAVLEIIGPITITSAFRCSQLNTAVGSSDRSQHIKFEAADFVPVGDLNDGFRELWRAVKAGKIEVGQLIHETAERPGGHTSWIHVSLGSPWRPQERCQQVLRMEHGKYTLLV